MSTYLVAFVVGPARGHRPGRRRRRAAPGRARARARATWRPSPSRSGPSASGWFADYYGIPYPGDKLDLIALPDFAAGAMENLGAITFREAVLLVDPDAGTQLELQRVADVVAHELAHMWFGDLVTMKWWNGLWLNEAFATFMELAAVDAFKPEWHRWVAFTNERAAAFAVDSLGQHPPHRVPGALARGRRGHVRRPHVPEGRVGPPHARAVPRHRRASGPASAATSSARQFGNAETTDLWDAIEEATGEPVRRIMDSWIFQGGYPHRVRRAAATTGGSPSSQQRFAFAGADDGRPAATWSVPLLVLRAATATDRVLLEEPADARPTSPSTAAWPWSTPAATASTGCATRPSCSRGSWRPSPDLAPIERALLVDDTWAAVLAGETPAPTFLELAAALRRGDRPHGLDHPRLALGADRPHPRRRGRERFRAFVRDLARPAFERLGWDAATGRGRAHPPAAGHPHHPARRARATTPRSRPGPASCTTSTWPTPSAVDPNVAAAVVGVVAAVGDDGGLRRVPRAVPDGRLAPGVAALPVRPGRLPRPGAGPARRST